MPEKSAHPFAWVGLSLMTAIISGCAVAPALPEPVWPPVSEKALLGSDLSGATAENATSPADLNILALDDSMRTFAETIPHNTRESDASRLERLLFAMRRDRLFQLDYDSETTQTAIETFHARSGNCLSFTNLVIALAREIGLNARYQLVDVPQISRRDDDLVIVYGHINTLIQTRRTGSYEVDFNPDYGRTAFRRRPIDDQHAKALYLNNLAAEALVKGDKKRAFSLLRQAIATSDKAVAPWTNLGVMYRRSGNLAAAESAYRSALFRNPQDQTTRHNLVRLYEAENQIAAAASLRQQLNAQQLKNPYYHHFRGTDLLEKKQWREAGLAFYRAIKLNPREAMFFASLAQAQIGLGDIGSAQANLREAIRLSLNPNNTQAWQRQLIDLGVKEHLIAPAHDQRPTQQSPI